MLLRDAVDLFLGEYKPSTQQAYRGPLYRMRDWLGPARPLENLQSAHLVEYFQDVKAHGYSPATLQKHAKSIKTFFNWCVRLRLMEASPARFIRAPKPPRLISREKAMRDDELERILEYLLHKTVPRDYALVLFLADTGCRRGGAATLRLQDIDFEALTAEVTEKGERARKVAFGEKCAQAIRRWLAYRGDHYAVKGTYVFSVDGLPLKPEVISQAIRRACKRVGVRTLSSHSLRHRKGHQFADHRIAPSIAATALGHSDPMITVSYYYPSDWETAQQALRELATRPQAKSKIVNLGGD